MPLAEEDGFKEAIQDVVDMDEDAINAKREAIDEFLKGKLQLEKLKEEYMKVFKL